jgi:light-regulated signal transduction histidine kinase (bacteriophytochrome)
VANSIVAELQKSDDKRQVEFHVQEGITAVGDLHLFRVMLQNLLDNSWKFTSKHASARIEFGCKSLGNGPTYFVKDDGAGFDARYSGRLFGAFQRLHGVTEFPGTGIGLATVQRVVHRHGGRVWAEGEVEKGATFYFTL